MKIELKSFASFKIVSIKWKFVSEGVKNWDPKFTQSQWGSTGAADQHHNWTFIFDYTEIKIKMIKKNFC